MDDAPCMHPPCDRERDTDLLVIRRDTKVSPHLTVRVCERCKQRDRYRREAVEMVSQDVVYSQEVNHA